jgi:hypothetical protein
VCLSTGKRLARVPHSIFNQLLMLDNNTSITSSPRSGFFLFATLMNLAHFPTSFRSFLPPPTPVVQQLMLAYSRRLGGNNPPLLFSELCIAWLRDAGENLSLLLRRQHCNIVTRTSHLAAAE